MTTPVLTSKNPSDGVKMEMTTPVLTAKVWMFTLILWTIMFTLIWWTISYSPLITAFILTYLFWYSFLARLIYVKLKSDFFFFFFFFALWICWSCSSQQESTISIPLRCHHNFIIIPLGHGLFFFLFVSYFMI